MKAPAVAAYRFGPFELRVDDHVLLRDGRRVSLSPKAVDLLELLVAEQGRVVAKTALLEALWPNTYVEEANLSVQVAAVRKALAPEGIAFIETIAKRGYRFVAKAQVVTTTAGRPVKILVLPLNLVGEGSEMAFLAFSLPQAIASSLADSPALSVLRMPDRKAGLAADQESIRNAGADVVARGTLNEVDGEAHVHITLVDAKSGTTLLSIARGAPPSGLFDLQKELTGEIARTLVKAGVSEAPVARAAALASPGAYVFYLRANQLAYETTRLPEARDLYEMSVAEDPNYAPAWARLARCHRVMGKFVVSSADVHASFARAEAAFKRALAIDPDLSLAHSLYAQLEVDLGRGRDAMLRLIERAAARPNASDLFAGLVPALRFCGLLDWSVAAHHRARALEPGIPTGIHHTWWMKGDYHKALGETFGDIGYMPGLALASAGREREAIAALRWRERESTDLRARPYLTSLRALLEGHRDECLTALEQSAALQIDAEALYYLARTYAKLGRADDFLSAMERVIAGGFYCYDTFLADPWLESVRELPRAGELLARARTEMIGARAAFQGAGGEELLG